MKRKIRYLWLDHDGEIRNKLKIASDFKALKNNQFKVNEWNFDGSSTNQSTTEDSDLTIKPCRVYVPFDPQHPQNFKHEDFTREIIVLCTVHDSNGNPVLSEKRPQLESLNEKYKSNEWWFGIEQEYTLFKGGKPLGWPSNDSPEAQGAYYCGVGQGIIDGQDISNEHVDECIIYDISIYGTNAEVMLGQWEYQIGTDDALKVSDDIIVSRYLLHRIAQKHQVKVSLHPKPMLGDWNGAGAHTNFSTKQMRNENTGKAAIDDALKQLEKTHSDCIPLYGDEIDRRLLGTHETSSIDHFSYGEKNRECSVRIPISVAKDGYGYLEDRRPCANINPYIVCSCIMSSVEGDLSFFDNNKPIHIIELTDYVSNLQSLYHSHPLLPDCNPDIAINIYDEISLLNALLGVLNSASDIDFNYIKSKLPFGDEVSSLDDINCYVTKIRQANANFSFNTIERKKSEYTAFSVDGVLKCMVYTLLHEKITMPKEKAEEIKKLLEVF